MPLLIKIQRGKEAFRNERLIFRRKEELEDTSMFYHLTGSFLFGECQTRDERFCTFYT